MAAVILEIFSRGRGQPQFRRVRQFPYRIGRAYDNDLILTDDAVSAHHLQLEQDAEGQIKVRNLSHENGTVLNKKKLGYVPSDCQLPCDLYVGHTHLRLLSPEAVVTPTKRLQHTPGMSWFQTLPGGLIMLALVLAMNVFIGFSEQVLQRPLYQILTRELPVILSPLILATITAFISRLLLHRWQFPLHLSIACIAILLARGGMELVSLTSYYFTSEQAGSVVSNLMAATVFTALFAWQLRAFSTLTRERSTMIAIGIIWPLLLLFWLQAYVRAPDFRSQPAMHTTLRVSDIRAEGTLAKESFLQLTEAELREGLAESLAEHAEVVIEE